MIRQLFLFTVALILASPVAAVRAQQPSRVPVVGFLATAAVAPDDPLVEAFRTGLRELGYVENQNIKIEFRSAQGQVDQLPRLTQELVQLKVSAIVVGTEVAVRAAKQATSMIPIVAVLFDYDPVASGLIDSFRHPGANITGIFTRTPELVAKRLELLKETLPGLSRVAVFWDSFGRRQLDEVTPAANSLGILVEQVELGDPYNFKAAFKRAKQKRAEAVLILYSGVFYKERVRIAQQALEDRMPTMSYLDQLTRAGGLMSYGADARDSYRRIAYFIDRLLKGATPNDLPVEQSAQFKLVVNQKTAKALGIAIPQSILLRADEVNR